MNIRYLRYIRSVEWQRKRQAVLQRDGYRCQLWFEHPGEEVHHRTYEHLYDEPLEDLITLCRQCHEMITNMVRRSRYQRRTFDLSDHQRITSIVEVGRINTPLPLSNVLRYTPLPQERITHGLSIPAVQSFVRRTPDPAQRSDE